MRKRRFNKFVGVIKDIFVPSRTDDVVREITDANERQMKEVTKQVRFHTGKLQDGDVAMKIFVATGGKHGH